MYQGHTLINCYVEVNVSVCMTSMFCIRVGGKGWRLSFFPVIGPVLLVFNFYDHLACSLRAALSVAPL